jgi:hypothetical protein
MRQLALLALLAIVLAATLATAADDVERVVPVDRRADAIVARSTIEARGRTHGEVRLVRRGSDAVVQTLLVTRTLRRAAGRIRDKEEANWPQGSRELGASRVYVEALGSAVAEILQEESRERERSLLIEIVASDHSAIVTFANPQNQDGSLGIDLVAAATISRLEMPCAWARRQIELIARDRGLDLAGLAPLPECAPTSSPTASESE